MAKHDELFEAAGCMVIRKNSASTGMLQRMLGIGFGRATIIMEQLADAGVVGKYKGAQMRPVLMTADQFSEYLITSTEQQEEESPTLFDFMSEEV